MKFELQLFLHILGAIVLFGATGAVAVLALAARHRSEQAALARTSFWTLLGLAVPAWVVMLGFGTWTESKADYPEEPGWLSLGSGIADLGLLLLLATTFLAFRWRRNPEGGGRTVTAIGVLSCLLLVAIAVAWWAMSAKVPS
jgi:hypothetical protein